MRSFASMGGKIFLKKKKKEKKERRKRRKEERKRYFPVQGGRGAVASWLECSTLD